MPTMIKMMNPWSEAPPTAMRFKTNTHTTVHKNWCEPTVRASKKNLDVLNQAMLVLERTKIELKIDVPRRRDLYIISQDGKTCLQQIEINTGTSIRLPAWRPWEASQPNELSLHGFLEDVEQARALVRLTSQLIFRISLPSGPRYAKPCLNTPYVNMARTRYNMQVLYTEGPSSTIFVTGCERYAAQVQAVTRKLLLFSLKKSVTLYLEISAEHLAMLMRNNMFVVFSIMVLTKTEIDYISGKLCITGSVDDVYKARQQLLGNLPIELHFKLPAYEVDYASARLLELSTKYELEILLNTRDYAPLVIIKGLEQFIGRMYEAREELLVDVCNRGISECSFAPLEQAINSTSVCTVPMDSPQKECSTKIEEAAANSKCVQVFINLAAERLGSSAIRPVAEAQSTLQYCGSKAPGAEKLITAVWKQ